MVTLSKASNVVVDLMAMLTCSLALADSVVPVVGCTSNQNPCRSLRAGSMPSRAREKLELAPRKCGQLSTMGASNWHAEMGNCNRTSSEEDCFPFSQNTHKL